MARKRRTVARRIRRGVTVVELVSPGRREVTIRADRDVEVRTKRLDYATPAKR
jgi:hypothetical protein